MSHSGPVDINPRVDIVFHDLFGRAGNEDLLIALLNEVLGPDRSVTSVRLRDPFQLPDQLDEKLVIVDLEAEASDGRVYHVEMQTTVEVGIGARVMFTWASIFRRQLQKGESYGSLMPVISIWFCDRNVVRRDPRGVAPWHTCWKVRDEGGLVWSDHLEVHTIELDRWRRAAQPTDGRWVRFLAEAERWAEVPEEVRDPLMEKAMQVLERYHHDEHARAVYEARLREEHRQATQELAVRQERERAERAEAERDRERAERLRAEAEREALLSLLRAHGIAVPAPEAAPSDGEPAE